MIPIIGNLPILPVESNGGIPVNVQDQTTQPDPAYFLQTQTTFSLAADTVASTVDVLNFKFNAAPGHLLTGGEEILLLDRLANRYLMAIVLAVNVDEITIDRPVDHVFPAAGPLPTLGRIVSSEASVDGSQASPQIFSVRAGAVPADYITLGIHMLCDSAGDRSLFGNLDALTNGLVFRIVNGFQRTVYNFKSNGEIGHFASELTFDDRAGGGGLYSVTARFNLRELLGVALRISTDDVLQWVVQDPLATDGLLGLKFSIGGHLTQDETS